MGFYAALALNWAVFSPVAKAMDDYSFTDFYYGILDATGERDTSNIVTIVDMTELTNRRDLAYLIADIEDLHPKVLGVDIVFEGLKEDSVGDMLLTEVVQNCHNAVFSYKLIEGTDGQSIHSFFMPCDSVQEGFTNMPRQLYGGMKRSLNIGRQFGNCLRPSFIKLVADVYADCELLPLADRELKINFSPIHYRVVPFDSIQENAGFLEDHIVLLGAMKEEADMHYTPQGKVAGVVLLAYAIETMIHQNQIRELPVWMTVLVSYMVVLVWVMFIACYTQQITQKSDWIRLLLSASLIRGFWMFLWMALVVWIAFILFCQYDISVNMAPAIAATAFIANANNLYEILTKLIIRKKKDEYEKN